MKEPGPNAILNHKNANLHISSTYVITSTSEYSAMMLWEHIAKTENKTYRECSLSRFIHDAYIKSLVDKQGTGYP